MFNLKFWMLFPFLWLGLNLNRVKSEYKCYDPGMIIMYQNNASKQVTGLPTIRFTEPYYGSQYALQYAGYVFLRDVMGVSVEWTSIFTPTDVSGTYPVYFWDMIKNDQSDILLEAWPVDIADMYNQVNATEVYNGGFTGVYGELSVLFTFNCVCTFTFFFF